MVISFIVECEFDARVCDREGDVVVLGLLVDGNCSRAHLILSRLLLYPGSRDLYLPHAAGARRVEGSAPLVVPLV